MNRCMQAQCPNCRFLFDIHPHNLPQPKYNTVYHSFGWKLECGYCSTQWWYGVEGPSRPKAPDHTATHKVFAPPPQRQAIYPTPTSPLSHQDEGFGYGATPQASVKLWGVQRTRKTRRWLSLKLLAIVLLILIIEYFFPKKINQTIRGVWQTVVTVGDQKIVEPVITAVENVEHQLMSPQPTIPAPQDPQASLMQSPNLETPPAIATPPAAPPMAIDDTMNTDPENAVATSLSATPQNPAHGY